MHKCSLKAKWFLIVKLSSWFKNVADDELKNIPRNNHKQNFTACYEFFGNFKPPPFPSSLWNTLSNSSTDMHRLKTENETQDQL